MKMNFGTVVISAGLCGLLSFILLALSIGTEYWYIIDVDEGKNSSLEYSSSHSGLWRIYEGKMVNTDNLSFFYVRLCAPFAHILPEESALSSSPLRGFKHCSINCFTLKMFTWTLNISLNTKYWWSSLHELNVHIFIILFVLFNISCVSWLDR